MPDYDAIIVGGGHNGLVASAFLAKSGLKVLCLERQGYVGGMAGTTQFFEGFRHNVGAWCLMASPGSIVQDLGLRERGLEVIDPPTSFHTFGEPGDAPYIFYNDHAKLAEHLRTEHGEDALQALEGLYRICRVFAKAFGVDRFKAPRSLGAVVDGMPTPEGRDIMRRFLFGSCMDMIREYFPQPDRHRVMQGSIAAMASDGTGQGPYSQGTAFSLGYHMAAMAVGIHYQLIKGGMGMWSEAVKSAVQAYGGEVRLKSRVKRVLVQDGKATGVELVGGEKVSARVVLSNLDAYATFFKLMDQEHVPSDFAGLLRRIKHTNPYLQIHVTLKELPEFTGELARANKDNLRWSMSYIPSPDHLERCWDECKWGRVPTSPYSSYYIPSLLDSSMAPPGYHAATFWSQYFPITAPREQHDRLKEEMADRVIGQMCRFAPNLKDAIIDRVVFTPLHYEGMFGVTGGDYASGLMRPDQVFDFRPVVGWSEYRTPIKNLYLCGAACHPGPGVNGVPGYNSAHTVLRDWEGIRS